MGRMPEHALIKRITRWRMLGAFAAVAIVAAAATLSGSVAQGRVVSGVGGTTTTQLLADTIAIATGGGTVEPNPTTIASFGVNGKRPPGFVQNGTGTAQGRINYDVHAQMQGRHVNVPVTFMNAEIASPQTGNQTGGRAQLIGDCSGPGAECPSSPPGIQSVLVYVEDNSDSGADSDKFQISYCTSPASVVVTGGGLCPVIGPLLFLRTGNIQIRTNVSGSGGNAPTSARAPIRLP
jgi:hypothetical protein